MRAARLAGEWWRIGQFAVAFGRAALAAGPGRRVGPPAVGRLAVVAVGRPTAVRPHRRSGRCSSQAPNAERTDLFATV